MAVKTLEQQATLTLHRQREQLVKMRLMQTNALRGLLYEFGATFAKGRVALFKEVEATLEGLQSQLPQMVADSLREQVQRIKVIGQDIAKIEKRLGLQLSGDKNMQRVQATAVIATMGEASAFKSGREFCAWLGLVPKQTGSGGKVRLGHISKRGDKYVRTLLIHGARAALCRAKEPSGWLLALKERRPTNVAIVAQAAKMARTIWAVTAKEQEYQRGHQSVRPAMA